MELVSHGDPAPAERLDMAREAFSRKAWADAFELFGSVDRTAPLGPDELKQFAEAAALSGHDRIMVSLLERRHGLLVDAGRHADAALAAFWAGFRLFSLGEAGRATAWLQRARRCVDAGGSDCVARGYLLLPRMQRCLEEKQYGAALDAGAKAIGIGETFGDPSLVAFARTLCGVAHIRRQECPEGMGLLDEAMLAATGGDLSPIVTGLVYCTVIANCCRIFAMDRASEWTSALTSWCAGQPQMVPFSGVCMVHRAEIRQLQGAWSEAIVEAQDAARHLDGTPDRAASASARYQEGEIHRLRGRFRDAERCYGEASRLGREPMPGLALLRLAQGRHKQAEAAIRRVIGASAEPLARVQLLPAFVRIMLAVGETDAAEAGCVELEDVAQAFGTEILRAMAAHARGAVLLSGNDPSGALGHLRPAFSTWNAAGAPYLAAQVRIDIASACTALGDADSAVLELAAAQAVFSDLGAEPDLAVVTRMMPATAGGMSALSRREMEVLRLMAEGMTNRAIAAELDLSPKTVDRHVGNLFNKLGVSSRAAATAAAYRQKIL